jgi:hypothetical protein
MMAVTRELTDVQTESVKQLLQAPAASLLAEMHVSLAQDATLYLRESFALFQATVKDLVAACESGLPLLQACRETGTWHHQIAFGEQVSAFGKTAFDPASGNSRFLALMNGELCRQLDQAVRLADKQFGDDYTAWFVRIAEVNIYFLLLARGVEEWVLLVSSPWVERGLATGDVLSPRDFGERLRALPSVVGVDLGSK